MIFPVNHVNRLSVQFSNLLKTVYKSESDIQGGLSSTSLAISHYDFSKMSQMCVLKRRRSDADARGTPHAIQRRDCKRLYFCSLFSFGETTENRT